MPKSEESAGSATTEEKYTLPRVLEIVRGHAKALEEASTSLYQNDCKDPKLLRSIGTLAYDAAEELWEIDGCAPPGHDADLYAAWHTFGRVRCTVDLLYRPMFTLPVLVLAVEAATKDPQGQMPAGKRWDYCRYQADHVVEDLMEWVTAHEADATPATTTEQEAEEDAEPERKEPLDAVDIHYKVQDALRPLRMLADSETLLHGTYRDGENDAESDRAEDLARLAKQAYESLRTFEDTGRDPILPEARDLLWWGQAVCVALNVLALRLSEDLGSAVPDGIRIDESNAVHSALDILSKDSFERVRADGGDIEQAQAEKVREAEASQ